MRISDWSSDVCSSELTADDDDRARIDARARRGRRRFIPLRTHEHRVAHDLRVPRRQRRERRSPQRSARAQAETGVVQRTAHLAVYHQPLAQRPAVVRAAAGDRVEAVVQARQQYRFAVDVAGKHAAVRYVGQWHALGQVGTRWNAVGMCHGESPSKCIAGAPHGRDPRNGAETCRAHGALLRRWFATYARLDDAGDTRFPLLAREPRERWRIRWVFPIQGHAMTEERHDTTKTTQLHRERS